MKLPQFAFRPSLILVFAIGACLALFLTQAVPAAAATLTINPSSLWTGYVPVGQSTTLSATLANSGPEIVTISAAVASNVAYAVISPSFPLQLTGGSGSLGGATPVATVVAKPPTVSFGKVPMGSSVNVYETLTNSGTIPLVIPTLSILGAGLSVRDFPAPVTLTPGGSITFKLSFTPFFNGAVAGKLTVFSNANKLIIPISGNAAANGTLAISPPSANLGSVAVGSSKTMTASLSAAGSSVTVSSASTTSSEFTITGIALPVTIPAGQSVPITLRFAPTSSGAATGTISFASNAANSPASELLTGTGSAAPAVLHDVTLSWNPSASATGYNVYRGTVSGGPYSKLNGSIDDNASYSDTTVQTAKTYYYVVTGVDPQGKESGYSNQVTAVVP